MGKSKKQEKKEKNKVLFHLVGLVLGIWGLRKNSIVTGILGFLLGAILLGQVNFAYNFPVEHIGGVYIGTFSYTNFDGIYRGPYEPDSIITDQKLTVQNHYKGTLVVATEINNPYEDISIECYINNSEQDCDEYYISPDLPVELSLLIKVGSSERKTYEMICIKTYNKQRKFNSENECLSLDVGSKTTIKDNEKTEEQDELIKQENIGVKNNNTQS